MRALSISITGLSLILLFWAVVLVSALSGDGAFSILRPNGFAEKLFNIWEYWYGFVGAIMGGLIGYWIAVWQGRKEKKRDLEIVRAGIIWGLNRNIEVIDTALTHLNQNIYPNYTLDESALSVWIARGLDYFSDDFSRELAGLLFQYSHVSKKMELLFIERGRSEGISASDVRDHLLGAKMWTLSRLADIRDPRKIRIRK